jgi:hypothetical protein
MFVQPDLTRFCSGSQALCGSLVKRPARPEFLFIFSRFDAGAKLVAKLAGRRVANALTGPGPPRFA